MTIACVPSAAYHYLPEFISRYRTQFPLVSVQIQDDSAGDVLDSVTRGEADFGINFVGRQESGIEFHPLRERFVMACHRNHPLAAKRRVTWTELCQHDYVSVSKSSGNRLLIDQALADLPARPACLYEARHVAGVLGLVEAGLGVAAVPQLAMPQFGNAVVISRPLVDPVVARTLGLIRRRGRTLTPAAQTLYRLLATNRLPKRIKPPSQ